jgi:hypothetical protein
MIFGKDSEAVKLELERMGNSMGRRLEEISESQKETAIAVEELRKRIEEELSKRAAADESGSWAMASALDDLNNKLHAFEKSVASFDNIKNRIDDVLLLKVKEITEVELNAVKSRMAEFTSLQESFKALQDEMVRMRAELSKWNAISSQVKEIDFSLQRHAKELELADNRKLELEKENENLKDILSKMKRSRMDGQRRY